MAKIIWRLYGTPVGEEVFSVFEGGLTKEDISGIFVTKYHFAK
jgi:hypothetical protein